LPPLRLDCATAIDEPAAIDSPPPLPPADYAIRHTLLKAGLEPPPLLLATLALLPLRRFRQLYAS